MPYTKPKNYLHFCTEGVIDKLLFPAMFIVIDVSVKLKEKRDEQCLGILFVESIQSICSFKEKDMIQLLMPRWLKCYRSETIQLFLCLLVHSTYVAYKATKVDLTRTSLFNVDNTSLLFLSNKLANSYVHELKVQFLYTFRIIAVFKCVLPFGHYSQEAFM